MAGLQRITTTYVDVEDRMRLAGQSAAGEVVTLWLTRRLLDRLLPHLLSWLERSTPLNDVNPGMRAHAQGALQGFAQMAARAALGNEEPVDATAPLAEWRVGSVDVSQSGSGLMLRFRDDGEQQAELPMSVESLRQWLNILLDQYRAAGWPLQVWPVWMCDALPMSVPVSMH